MAVWANLGAAYNGLASTKSGAESEALQQKSIDAWAKAVALKPADAASRNNYALSLAKDGKYTEAETELIQAARLDPANACQYYFNFAAILVNSGREAAAAKVFRMAIDAAPDDARNAESYYQYALCLTQQATLAPDGRIVPAPGTMESFSKYRALAPDGSNVNNADRFVARLEETIETYYRSPAMSAVPARRIAIDGPFLNSRVIHQVAPVYPPEARQARITGAVELRAVIAP
jgi:tetratricopeptide (TPR) repeat protein